MAKKKERNSVLEKYFLPNPSWQEGYQSFLSPFKRSTTWLALLKESEMEVVKLDRRGGIPKFIRHTSSDIDAIRILSEKTHSFLEDDFHEESVLAFEDDRLGKGYVLLIKHLGRIKGVFYLLLADKDFSNAKEHLQRFDHFLVAQVELAFKSYELNNFYETVHPRALALSTMHSVHRVISSSLRLNELLPRIGRLSAQVLKAKGCSIMLVDSNDEFLIPYFAFGQNKRFIHTQRVRVGRGLQGGIAASGEFHLSRSAIAVPFIEDDVVGVITLWNRIDGQAFSKIDLEILKSLSEQAVVAIKNAQLFEETEKLTLGSIQTINELLELNFKSNRSNLPLFRSIVLGIGQELGLSSREQTHLERAVLLLDTGTIAVSEKILQKKGKLTKKEFAQIKRIPMRGANLLKSISSLQPVIPIVMHHHECFDGSGYPQGLEGEEIPIGARIVSVVNSFLAMISRRSYRDRLSCDKAIEEIESNRGTQFDPAVVDAFRETIANPNVQESIYALSTGQDS